MSITRVHLAINRHLRDVTVKRFVSESFIKGRHTPVFADPETVSLAHFPLTPKELKFLPEGAYNSQDKSFYELGAATIPSKSEAVIGSERFVLDPNSDRDFEGGFTKYLGKRISDDTSAGS